MKLVALWLVVLGFAAVTAGSCSVSHRSGDFSCQTTADCSDGRICSDGLCVGSSSMTIDASVADAPTTGCPAQCTSCNLAARSCTIDCALNNGACNRPVACPPGWTCNVACTPDGSCRSGVTCADRACKVECSGTNSCRNVSCGTGACNIDCQGTDSCRAVNCGVACACDVACGFDSQCTTVNCSPCVGPGCALSTCAAPIEGCSSMQPGCNTCK